MTSSAHLTAAVFALVFSAILLVLLRRDHIYIRQVIFWLVVTFAVLVLGLVPGLVDMVGRQFGISYPPIVVAIAAILVLMVKGLEADLAMTRMERRIRRLSQRLAILEGDHEGAETARKDT